MPCVSFLKRFKEGNAQNHFQFQSPQERTPHNCRTLQEPETAKGGAHYRVLTNMSTTFQRVTPQSRRCGGSSCEARRRDTVQSRASRKCPLSLRRRGCNWCWC